MLVENLELVQHLPPRVVVEHVDGLRGSVALALAAANDAERESTSRTLTATTVLVGLWIASRTVENDPVPSTRPLM